MKLYTPAVPYQLNQSLEQFRSIYMSHKSVSTESVSVFFAKVKDTFTDKLANLTQEHSKYAQGAMDQKRAVLLLAKEVKFQYFSAEVVNKPESFDGYYTEYLKELIATGTFIASQTPYLIETVRMSVATFINEGNDNKVDQIYGHVVYKDAIKSLPKHKEAVAKFFTSPSGKFKARAGDVLKSMQDFEVLFAQAEQLGKIFNDQSVKTLQAEVQSLTELIDTLIQVNMTSGVLNKSSTNKQELIDAIYLTAQYVEYYHALLANWVFYCKAFSELKTALVKMPSGT